ncbi:Y-family DNA polymerase [Cognatilysobacter tabacisoli]|uniref:Y-family DNA polymerase n=1 Tax=Cognatilysobacter tabacisoli TaxID=2315424 RepID=UPI000E6B339B|nr:DNA polymerase Y family protein [Lysobacter tabacisoli]
MLWACIALPQLALDAVQRRLPDPTRALALVGGPAHLRHLHAVNAAAEAMGLAPGMRLSAAQALCAQAQLVEHDESAEARWQRFLAAWAYRHSSLVSAQWSGAIVLEARASFRLFGPWPRFAARLREELQALGFTHRLALAPTPRAARVLAGLRDGLAVGSGPALALMLDRVPTRRAALPDDAGERLHAVGARTLAAVRALPRDGLRRRFGAALLEHLDRLYGEADDPLAYYLPPDHFDARVELGYEVESHQALLFPLRRLVNDLAVYLSGRDGGVQRFALRLEHAHGHTEVPVGLLAAERDAALLFEIARNRLEQASIGAPVVGLRLLARELPPFVPAERDLFDARPAQAVPWPQLRERLRARLGDESVYRIAADGDPRPERAWRRAGPDDDALCAVPAPRRPPRPAWLLPRPVPLRDPDLRIVSGPERLESGWWDGADARRDYYVLETSQGQRAWAFAAPGEQCGWMLHGWFA